MDRRDFCLGLTAGAAQLALLSPGAANGAAELQSGVGDVSQLTVAGASKAIRSGEISCVDLTHACLGRIDAGNERINAMITTMDSESIKV